MCSQFSTYGETWLLFSTHPSDIRWDCKGVKVWSSGWNWVRWALDMCKQSGNSLTAQEGSAAVRFGRESSCVLRPLFCEFVLCIPLFCIVLVPVPFVCCSLKLPLSWPTSFYLFLSILLCTPAGGRGGRVALLLLAAAKP